MLRALPFSFSVSASSSARPLRPLQPRKVTVNGEAITDFQIEQRLKLFQLEGRSGRQAAIRTS